VPADTTLSGEEFFRTEGAYTGSLHDLFKTAR
jgi:hypothetical protein